LCILHPRAWVSHALYIPTCFAPPLSLFVAAKCQRTICGEVADDTDTQSDPAPDTHSLTDPDRQRGRHKDTYTPTPYPHTHISATLTPTPSHTHLPSPPTQTRTHTRTQPTDTHTHSVSLSLSHTYRQVIPFPSTMVLGGLRGLLKMGGDEDNNKVCGGDHGGVGGGDWW